MEDQMKGQACEGKTCGMGGGGCCCFGHGVWHRVIRWIIGMAIILIVFCFGMMIGQLKGELGRSSGYRMMHNYGGYGRAYPMMQSGYGNMMGGNAQAAPATPTAPAK